MDKISKLSLPATILIASIILGGFYFASQVIKQRSIERQQQIKIRQDKREQLEKEIKKREARIDLLECLGDARKDYEAGWADACKDNARRITEGIQDCIRIGAGKSYCRGLWGKPDDSPDCLLSISKTNLLDKRLQQDRDECFKKYPQK